MPQRERGVRLAELRVRAAVSNSVLAGEAKVARRHDARSERGVVRRHEAALERVEELGRVEAEDLGPAAPATTRTVGVARAEGVRRVVDDGTSRAPPRRLR